MNSQIVISTTVRQGVFKHAESTYPLECCGFLFGIDEGLRFILFAKPAVNSKAGDQRRRFEIDPAEYIRAEQFAAENNLQLLGIYHSHPDHPAIASEHDLKRAMPFFSYPIVSVVDGKAIDFKSWKLNENERKFGEELVLLQQPA